LVNIKNDLILGSAIFIFSLFMLTESKKIPSGILDEQIGFVASPKGYLIVIASVLLLLSSILLLKTIRAMYLNKGWIKTSKEIFLPKEVFISMILLLFFVSTLNIFGFFLNSFILLVITMTIYYLKEKNVDVNNKKQLASLILKFSILSIISLIAIQQVFVRLLNVYLPTGILGF